jgi:hypothetical protein
MLYLIIVPAAETEPLDPAVPVPTPFAPLPGVPGFAVIDPELTKRL